ncbi:hypothetical protein SSS_07750 [Sarcoptes scabiei]|uniref:Wiskott-Aldrich syndrome protein family member n=1 Tax=Sarcoptes scabiei TaxID=52283 RepID=A0A834VG79_SARSC|nr:hypothetical protein SSS_07750 [Sarcoptes scabiei]
MPLEQRVIQPIYVSRGCFNNYQGQNTVKVPNELECVTNGTLGNIIRQLSSLSKHAENLFGCLLDNLGSMLQRSTDLNTRIENLTNHVERLDACNDYGEAYQNRNGHQANRLGNKSSSSMHRANGIDQFDQQVVARNTIPDSLREVYENCDPPPSLDKLNPFRDDNINGLKLYTNPNYFFELWRKEMLQEKSSKTKIARTKQSDNIHNSGGSGKFKKSRAQSKIHNHLSDNNSYSQQLPPSSINSNQIENQNLIYNQHPNQPVPQQHYQYSGLYNQHSNDQIEILTAKMNSTDLYGSGHTVIEGSYIDPNNYHHHYVKHQYNATNIKSSGHMVTGQTMFQNQSRPNSLDLQQQNLYNQNYNSINNPKNSQNQYGPGSTALQQNPSQHSPSATLTPTRRFSGTQVARPSAAPPAPPTAGNSAPNSVPGTPLQKKTTVINGQEVEMRGSPSKVINRDSLPPPPAPPSSQPSNGMNAEIDLPDAALPPPPPPPPNFNGISNNNFTSPLPPPPPPEIGNAPLQNNQFKVAGKPTAEELKSVVLKKIDVNSCNQNQSDPANDVRSNLLAAIRHGIKLKRVEESRQREVEQNGPLHDVASILARRVAMELSDSDGDGVDGENGGDSDAWDDDSEC